MMIEETLKPENSIARDRIVKAAAQLIGDGGVVAATTRAVAVAAGVQAPTIYRLFGDKDGLLKAVAEHSYAGYVEAKSLTDPPSDPVEALEQGWDAHIAFGLSHAALFRLIQLPAGGQLSTAAQMGLEVLRGKVRRVAAAGRLRVSEEQATDLLHSTATGVILTALDRSDVDQAVLVMSARDCVFTHVIGDINPTLEVGATTSASALRAQLHNVANITPGERLFLDELLRRIATQ